MADRDHLHPVAEEFLREFHARERPDKQGTIGFTNRSPPERADIGLKFVTLPRGARSLVRGNKHHRRDCRHDGRPREGLECHPATERQEPVVPEYVERALRDEPPVARPQVVPRTEELTDHRVRRPSSGKDEIEDLDNMTNKRGGLHNWRQERSGSDCGNGALDR